MVWAVAPEGVTLVHALASVETWAGGTPVLQRSSIDADVGCRRQIQASNIDNWQLALPARPGGGALAPADVRFVDGSSAVLTSVAIVAWWRSTERLSSSVTIVA